VQGRRSDILAAVPHLVDSEVVIDIPGHPALQILRRTLAGDAFIFEVASITAVLGLRQRAIQDGQPAVALDVRVGVAMGVDGGLSTAVPTEVHHAEALTQEELRTGVLSFLPAAKGGRKVHPYATLPG